MDISIVTTNMFTDMFTKKLTHMYTNIIFSNLCLHKYMFTDILKHIFTPTFITCLTRLHTSNEHVYTILQTNVNTGNKQITWRPTPLQPSAHICACC